MCSTRLQRKFLRQCASSCANVLAPAMFALGRLDRKHVVFGAIRDGVSTLKAVEQAGSPDGTPTAKVQIVDCGTIDEQEEKEEDR